MPIVGETVLSVWRHNWNDNNYTESWEINIPPTPTLVKASTSSLAVGDTLYVAFSDILRYRRRLPSGADETIDFEFNPQAIYEAALTSVTFQLVLRHGMANLMGVLEYWG